MVTLRTVGYAHAFDGKSCRMGYETELGNQLKNTQGSRFVPCYQNLC